MIQSLENEDDIIVYKMYSPNQKTPNRKTTL